MELLIHARFIHPVGYIVADFRGRTQIELYGQFGLFDEFQLFRLNDFLM
jgi:hypothetical protein